MSPMSRKYRAPYNVTVLFEFQQCRTRINRSIELWTPYHSKSVIAESGAAVGDSAVCDFSFRVNLAQFMLDRRTVRISLLFSL